MDACSHIVQDGPDIESYFEKNKKECFYGRTLVLSLPGSNWKQVDKDKSIHAWEVTKEELLKSLERVTGSPNIPPKILITAQDVPKDSFGRHDPDCALYLSEEAARALTSSTDFNLYGTSWKSTDFKPGSMERPIHKIILKQAVIFECLKLDHVPEGEYVISSYS